MPGKRNGLLALTLILVSALLVPTLLTDIASAGDWQTNSCGVNGRDCNAGCEQCAVGACGRCPSVSGYSCDLYGCAWFRNYGCSACLVR